MPEALRGKYQYFTQADLTKLRGYCKNVEITPLAGSGGATTCRIISCRTAGWATRSARAGRQHGDCGDASLSLPQ